MRSRSPLAFRKMPSPGIAPQTRHHDVARNVHASGEPEALRSSERYPVRGARHRAVSGSQPACRERGSRRRPRDGSEDGSRTSVRPRSHQAGETRKSPLLRRKLVPKWHDRVSGCAPRARSHGSPASGISAFVSVRLRPTIMDMIVSVVVVAVGTVPTYSPSRMTVTRSETSLSSSILCEM